MTEPAGRVARAVRDHGSFERDDDGRFEATSTAFEATVTAAESGADVEFAVTVRVPTLSAVVTGEVAPVVEEGWLETFELRVADAGGVTRGNHDLDPDVRRDGGTVVVEASFTDVNERRGVDDAAAVVDYVEGTYVQGIIPGYEYGDPVSGLIDRARTGGQ
jgi:hypothetical protein